MELLAQAWYDNLLPPLLADSLSFNKFIACISRESFRMPGRSKLTELIDNIYAKMLLRLKPLLQQCHSLLMQRCQQVTLMWQSPAIGLLSAVLGVSITNVSHTLQKRLYLLNELGVKYTLDDRLDAIASDNGANCGRIA